MREVLVFEPPAAEAGSAGPRPFPGGVDVVSAGGAVAGALLPEFIVTGFAAGSAPQDVPGYDPPALTGLRRW